MYVYALSQNTKIVSAGERALYISFEGTRQLKFKLAPGNRDWRDIIYTSALTTPVNNANLLVFHPWNIIFALFKPIKLDDVTFKIGYKF